MALDYLAGELDEDDYVRDGGGWFTELGVTERERIAAHFAALPVALEIATSTGRIGIVHGDCPFACWRELVAALHGDDTCAVAALCMTSRDRITTMDDSGVMNVDRVFVGHTPVHAPIELGNVHYIDTGAVFGHPLTVTKLD
jgi:serine/threonine protein phosphatase 1